MSDDVLAEASQEIIKGWRAGMQVAEFMARRRQRGRWGAAAVPRF